MILDIEKLRQISVGAEYIENIDGLYFFSRFSKAEEENLKGKMHKSSAGIQLVFKTDGTKLNLKVNTAPSISSRKYFSFDVTKNGEFLGCIKNFDESVISEKYGEADFILGAYSGSFDLGCGEKDIRIVFPHSCIGYLEEIEIEDASYVTPIKRDKKYIAYGDSITQGFDCLHPLDTYAMKLTDAINADIINKGIGGAPFKPLLAGELNDKNPQLVTVAYGTNDWRFTDKEKLNENCENFLKGIIKNYPSSEIIVITPIWRFDFDEVYIEGFKFTMVHEIIKEKCALYKNIKIIDGLELVPHSTDMFADKGLHPSTVGFGHYEKNLIKKVKEIITD